jgi:hypothetical protein
VRIFLNAGNRAWVHILTVVFYSFRYELKNEIGKSPVSKVPVELAKHEFAQHKVTREMKRKRDAEDEG